MILGENIHTDMAMANISLLLSKMHYSVDSWMNEYVSSIL